METILKIADAISNGEVVEIETAHVSGVSFLTIGKYGVEFLEHLSGYKVSVFTTSNPIAVDLKGVLGQLEEGQRRIINALRKMGVSITATCTPYEFVITRPRTYHAWAESSAVAYINTFRDAWSDKNPGPLALLAAITGYAPKTDLYREEGRRPTALVEAKMRVDGAKAAALGALIGEAVESGIPYIKGVEMSSEEARREFAASLPTYSSIVFAIVEGYTPNWKRYREIADFVDRFSFDEGDIAKYFKDSFEPDLIYLGCPFLDLETALNILKTIKSRGPARKPIYISTSPGVLASLGELVDEMAKYNVRIFAGSCLVVSAAVRSFKTVATNSLKAAYYIKRLHGVEISPCYTEKCIELAYA